MDSPPNPGGGQPITITYIKAERLCIIDEGLEWVDGGCSYGFRFWQVPNCSSVWPVARQPLGCRRPPLRPILVVCL